MKSKLFNNQPIKFVLVGILNTIFGYSLFAALISLKIHYTIAMLLTTCMGLLFNFKSTGKLVFNKSDNKLIYKYAVLYGITYFYNIILIHYLNSIYHHIYINGIIAMLTSAGISYVCCKNFIFTIDKVNIGPCPRP